MLALGLDIGTSKICVTVIDCKTGGCLENFQEPNNTFICIGNRTSSMQNAHDIKQKASNLVELALNKYPNIGCIGVTGQMHGILYIDSNNQILSPLYTWQDSCGDLPYDETGISYAKKLSYLTGYNMSSGFGLTTLFYHTKNNILYSNAKYISTIHGFIASCLADRESPLLHATDAHSLGLFDIETNKFDKVAVEKAGMDFHLLPETVDSPVILGEYKHKIPVCVAIGDNQAGFIGSGCLNDILVNIGTGSQISMRTKASYAKNQHFEIRPLTSLENIFVGASLCGGRAFALLKEFFADVINMANLPVPDDMYELMLKYLQTNSPTMERLSFSTLFCGTRSDSALKASINNIGTENFKAANMIDATLQGISDELYGMYKHIQQMDDSRKDRLIGSGNGIRKNPELRRILEHTFNMQLYVPKNSEEAAYGAALYGATAIEYFSNIEQAQKIIEFEASI